MIQKQNFNAIKGMRQDVSPSKANPEYIFDAKNIRLTARGKDTLLSISNEQSSVDTGIVLTGLAGYCIFNDYIIAFCRYSIKGNISEYIERISLNADNQLVGEIIYSSWDVESSNKYLNFNNNMQTLGIYENENIQKVYWVDGVNQPRVINIVKDKLLNVSLDTLRKSYNANSFDFVPKLQLQEEVTVENTIEGNGRFSSGIIQYAFTYYNKHGQESNIFYTSDLNYVTFPDRGGKPDDLISNAFKITINNLDSNFDYVRIYSIHRTSINATPEVKKVMDLPVANYNAAQDIYTEIYMVEPDINSRVLLTLDNGKTWQDLSSYSPFIQTIEKGAITENYNIIPQGSEEFYVFDRDTFYNDERKLIIEVEDLVITFNDQCQKIYISKENYSSKKRLIIANDNGTQEVETGSKLKLITSKSVANTLTFVDNNTTGESVDPTFLLYVGGEDITATTLSQKDNTLFLGNLSLKRPSIDNNLKKLLTPEYNATLLKWEPKLSITQDLRTVKVLGSGSVYYKYGNQLTAGNTSTFKVREHYRLGLQFQYNNGKWSEPIPINYDYTVEDTYYKQGSGVNKSAYHPSVDYTALGGAAKGYQLKYSLPYLYTELTTDIQEQLIELGYKKVRAVVVNPSLQDRKVILQGMMCPTVSTNENKENHNPDAQSSWFLRPFNVPEEIEYDGTIRLGDSRHVLTNGCGNISNTNSHSLKYIHQISGTLKGYHTNGNQSTLYPYSTEIEFGNNISEAHYENLLFRVNQNVLTVHSPDIEFDDSIYSIDQNKFSIRKVGKVEFDSNLGDISIQTSSPTIDSKSAGFIHATTSSLVNDTKKREGGRTLCSGFYYEDYIVDEDGSGTKFAGWQDQGVKQFFVCPWQSSGSLNNDCNRPANTGARSAVLKRKVISNIKTSFDNAWTNTSDLVSDAQVGIFNSNEVSLLKVDGQVYYGNVDTLIVPRGTYSKVLTSATSGGRDHDITTISESYYNAGKEVTQLKLSAASIRMKYKSTPHLVFNYSNSTGLTDDKSSNKAYLYLVEVYRNEITNPFGGTSDAALKANQWIPSGPAVPLSSTNKAVVQFLHGDCWYQRYDCLKTYPFTNEDENSIVEIGSFMVETRVNIDGRYDRNRGLSSNLNITPQNFNLLNDIYTQQDNFFNYRTLDKDFYKLNNFPNTITWSKEKTLSEDVDTWTNVTMANTFDLDGNLGQVISIENYNNELYCFQNKGISRILFNNRVQIPTGDNIPIEISNGYKVQGKVYLSNTVGCQNQKAIKVTPNGIYFSDLNNSGIYLLNQQGMQDISTPRGFTNWVKNYQPNEIYYDAANGDLYIIGKVYGDKQCICFSEKLNEFTSFMDYDFTYGMFNFNGDFYSCHAGTGQLYKLFSGDDYNKLLGTITPYHITYIANQNPTNDKIFNTIEFRGDSLNTNDKLIKGTDTKMPNICPFNKLTVWNEYQKGEETLNRIYGRPSNLKEKFRTWRANIPRDESNHRDRIRNPWAYIKLEGSNNTNRMQLHDLQVYYFDNSIIPQR